VHLSGLGANSLDVMVQFSFGAPATTVELRERHNVFLEIPRLARDLGVSVALPTRALELDELQAPGSARSRPEAPSNADLAEVARAFGPSGVRSNPCAPHIVPGASRPSPRVSRRPRNAAGNETEAPRSKLRLHC
jgi:hypothetical protein